MSIEDQEMETYQIFLVPMGNTKTTEYIEFHPRAPVLKNQEMEDLDDKEAPKDSVAPSNNIEKAREDFVAQSSEIDRTSK